MDIGLIVILLVLGIMLILAVYFSISEHLYHRKRRDKFNKDIDNLINKIGKK